MTHKVVEDELVSTQMTDLFSIFLRKEILVNKVRGKTKVIYYYPKYVI